MRATTSSPALFGLVALLALAGPAQAQDGTPWGSGGETKTAPRGESDDEGEEEGEDDADEDEDDGKTVSADRGDGPDLADEGADIDRIQLSLRPESVQPGATVDIEVMFFTEDNQAIPGVAFDLLGKGGEVSDVTEKDGVYTATLSVSVYTEDEAKVSVITEDGTHEMAAVEVDGDPVEAAAVADADAPEGKPEKAAKEPKEKKPKKEAEARDPHWLHVRGQGAGALYAYSQTPEDEPGPLIEDTLAFGGEAGAPANAAGFELSGTVWIPDADFIGVQANVRALGYSVESGAFSGAASDFLYDIGVYGVPRITVDVGDGQAWGGGRLGVTYSDFLLFAGCLDPGCGIEFRTTATPGIGLGPRGGIQIGPFIGELGYTVHLARVTQPYANALDVNAGLILVDPLTVELGFDVIGRTIALQGKDSGDVRGRIKDNQTVFSLGLGAVF